MPYTSKNGSASILARRSDSESPRPEALFEAYAERIREFAPVGADPALVMARPDQVTSAMTAYAERARRELVTPSEARKLAADAGLRLETLAGRDHGQVGALSALALGAGGEDGRVIHAAGWPWPDRLAGVLSAEQLAARGISELRVITGDDAGAHPLELELGPVFVRKRLRPAWRDHRIVLYVEAEFDEREGAAWRAVKRP